MKITIVFSTATRQFDSRGLFQQAWVPDVRVSSRTRPHCKEDCTYPVIENREGRVLKRYDSDETLHTIAKGRYSTIAYLQYEHDYPCSDKTCSETIFIDHQGRRSPSRSTPYGFSKLISKDKKIYSITSSGIYANTRLILASKHPTTTTHVLKTRVSWEFIPLTAVTAKDLDGSLMHATRMSGSIPL